MNHTNTFPKLHNAAWPGVVGKGSPGAEAFIDLDRMLDLTARAEVDGSQSTAASPCLAGPSLDPQCDVAAGVREGDPGSKDDGGPKPGPHELQRGQVGRR